MLTIVMPAYNEADVIAQTVEAWYSEVIGKIAGSELCVVNDGSHDATGDILRELQARLPQLRVLTQEQNKGHGPSTREGLLSSEKEFVFQTDSDGQFSPSEFWFFWEERQRYDFVLGVRKTRQDGWFRSAITWAMHKVILGIWGFAPRDANCAFKLMRRSKAVDILNRIPSNTFAPMVLLTIAVYRMKAPLKEIEVTLLPRQGGRPSLQGLGRWIGILARCVGDLVRFRLRDFHG